MTITYHGDACIRLNGKIGPQEYTVLFDPYDAKTTNLKPLRPSAADLVISTTGALPEFGEGPFCITGPGEYEVKGVTITGIAVGNRTIYRINAEEISLAYFGNLDQMPDEAAREKIGEADVLIVPVGGRGVLGAKQAAEIIEEIEPRVVIPIQYKLTGAKLPYDGPEEFCKEMGCPAKATEDKLKLAEKDLPTEGVEVRLLSVA